MTKYNKMIMAVDFKRNTVWQFYFILVTCKY